METIGSVWNVQKGKSAAMLDDTRRGVRQQGIKDRSDLSGLGRCVMSASTVSTT